MKKLLLLIVLLVGLSSVYAEGKIGVGVNYPGCSVKYVASPWAVEAKGQFGQGITVIGPRGYYYFPKRAGLFAGGEIDYVSLRAM